MSATKLADEGLAALEARKYDDAIEKLSKAIDTSKSPAWLLARSTAYMETRQLDKALRDAEYAYCTATERGNDKSRKQMIEAQHRRSVIYFRQKRYADADACAVWSQQLAKGVAVRSADAAAEYVDEKGLYHVTAAQIVPPEEKEKAKAKGAQGGDALARINSIMSKTDSKTPYEKDWQKAQTWRYSIVRFLEALPADDPARKLTAKLVPAKPSLEDKVERKEKEEHDPEIEAAKAELAQEKPASKPEVSNGPLRSQIYQTDSQITVTLFMKFANKEATEKVKVDFQPNMIAITGVPREPPTAFVTPYAAIDPSQSSYRVATMKIELKLAKATPGKWPTFGDEQPTKPEGFTPSEPTTSTNTAPVAEPISKKQENKAPAYPTSSKTGPKDWDKFSSDDKDDDADGDPNDFFRKLYADASPEARRAMMKSFQESNGTALSTDWASVSSKTVETQPPDGMEAKPW